MSDLEKRLAEVKAKYGKSVLQTVDEKKQDVIIPTDFYEFNKASNIGGCPLGKIIEIAGPPSSGKTALAWQLAACLSKATGKKILEFDYEQNFTRAWIKKLGVPEDKVVLAMPEEANDSLLSLEDGFEIMNLLLPSNEFCAVIWDSIATSNPKALLNKVDEKGLEGQEVAQTAAALTKALAVYAPGYRKSGTTIFFINHKRANMDVVANPYLARFADKERTPGGNAFKHHADMRIDMKPMDYITKRVKNDDGKFVDIKLGQNVKAKFIKNRVGDPYGEEILMFRAGIGFDIVSGIIKRALANGVVIRKSTGQTYLKDDDKISAPSYEGFWNLVHANPNLLETIKVKLSGGNTSLNSENIDLSAGKHELTVHELIGDDSESTESGADKPTDIEETKSEVNLDNLLQEKQTAPNVSSSTANVVKKRGRPAKVKV